MTDSPFNPTNIPLGAASLSRRLEQANQADFTRTQQANIAEEQRELVRARAVLANNNTSRLPSTRPSTNFDSAVSNIGNNGPDIRLGRNIDSFA